MNFDHKPPHIARRHERKVPGLGSLDGADLPIAPVEAVIIEPVKAANAAFAAWPNKLSTWWFKCFPFPSGAENRCGNDLDLSFTPQRSTVKLVEDVRK